MSNLGCPLYLGAAKRRVFLKVMEKMQKRFEGWKEKLLSTGGRLTFIKSVLYSIPLYFMALMSPPKQLLLTCIDYVPTFFGLTKMMLLNVTG